MQVEVSAEESKVKWYKDGEILSEADNHYEFKSAGRKHSIVIKNATVHHEGEYVASVGEQECSCELTVIGNNWFRPGVNFTKVLKAAFTPADPESAKKTVKLSSFFALLGSSSVKAASKMLVKLTPGVLRLKPL